MTAGPGGHIDVRSCESVDKLGPNTHVGAVSLTVRDLDVSLAFYESAIGMRTHRRDGDSAALGTGGEDLVVLHADGSARPAGRHAGLYHFALLHDSREELAHAVGRLAATGTPITGASDHGVSEAIYLNDPDRNGIELYADRPRAQWPPPDLPGARVGMYTIALDLDGLLALPGDQPPRDQAGAGLRMGHVHLHVGDLEPAVRFYVDVLGLDEMVRIPRAAFIAAGGYHHHLGINTWRGEGVPPAPADAVGLREWRLVVSEEDLDAAAGRLDAAGAEHERRDGTLLARDPSGNTVALTYP